MPQTLLLATDLAGRGGKVVIIGGFEPVGSKCRLNSRASR